MWEWKDSTSYSRGERGTVEPRSWTLGDNNHKSVVVHRRIDAPGTWFVSCYALDIESFELGTKSLETAKRLALVRVKNALQDLVGYYRVLGLDV
jgi:hypothetical protein